MRAMAAVDKYLVRRDDKLLLLFTPPFDNPTDDPGYIKGYPPGIRENGGQYTVASTSAPTMIRSPPESTISIRPIGSGAATGEAVGGLGLRHCHR